MLKRPRVLTAVLTAFVALGSAGCGLRYLGDSTTLFTKADQRLVVNAPGTLIAGRNQPRQIFCAEPSPDVAKAISESTNVSGALDAVFRSREAPAEGALKAAAAVSQAKAEALAQLTNRLATIQLLRDSLYRACEAYSNGALSEITYAIMLSRFDKVMVTLLSGELVAGNFGQSLAVLGTSASGLSQSAAMKSQEDAAKVAGAEKAADAARVEQATKKSEFENAQRALAICKAAQPPAPDCNAQQTEVDKKRTELAAADTKVSNAALTLGDVKAAAASNAATTFALGVGALPAGRAANKEAAVTEALVMMQRKYLENINVDPLMVACLMAFDRDGSVSHGQTLVSFCREQVPAVLRAQDNLLRTKLIDSQSELVAGCVRAFRETASADPKVQAAAKALTDFCEKQLVNTLKIHADLEQKRQDMAKSPVTPPAVTPAATPSR